LREAALALMRLKTEQWQLELVWGEVLRERILARLKQGERAVSMPGEEAADSQVSSFTRSDEA